MNHDRRYPLHWPDGWKRTPRERRYQPPYKVSEEKAKRDLLHSLHLLGARGVALSTNIELRLDGLPYSNRRTPEDVGIAVYFTRKGVDQVIACDKYTTMAANFRACGLTIEAFRAIDRAGASEILDRAFTGFAALPAAGGSSPVSWRIELGLESTPDANAAIIEAAYRLKAKTAHPDNGGSHDAFVRLGEARKAALAWLEGRS